MLLDARPEPAFRKERLPGAINIPSDDIRADALRGLPDKNAEIVVYCGNAPCQRSNLAAECLLNMGYANVRDYHEGKADWMKAALKIERGEISKVKLSIKPNETQCRLLLHL